MRILISMFTLCFLLVSCGSQRNTQVVESVINTGTENNESNENEEQSSVNNGFEVRRFIGKVILSREECPIQLVLQSENNTCYYPVNLAEKFKVDGAYLEFQKYPSRAPLPPGCESCQAIAIENVVRLKR